MRLQAKPDMTTRIDGFRLVMAQRRTLTLSIMETCWRWWPGAPSIIMAVVAAAVVNVGHICGHCRRQHWPSSLPLPLSIVDVNAGGRDCESIEDDEGGKQEAEGDDTRRQRTRCC